MKAVWTFFRRITSVDTTNTETVIMRKRILILVTMQTVGVFFLVVSVATPDIIQVTQQGFARDQARIGFFQTCTFNPFRSQNFLQCEYKSVQGEKIGCFIFSPTISWQWRC